MSPLVTIPLNGHPSAAVTLGVLCRWTSTVGESVRCRCSSLRAESWNERSDIDEAAS